MTTLAEQSRTSYVPSGSGPTTQELMLGCSQRIADATELMAKNYQRLLDDRDYWKRRAAEEIGTSQRLHRKTVALRGVITRMKNRAHQL